MRHEVESSYCLIDIQQSIILILMMLLALIFTLITIQKQEEEETKSPGDIVVQLFWPNDKNVDLDLWVQAPGDRPVGYSNKSGTIFNLLRDDLGFSNDVSGVNEEVAYTRGQPNGEYRINVHSYRGINAWPVTAKIVLLHRDDIGNVLAFWSGEYVFKGENQEYTFVRFYVQNKKVLEEYNFIQIPLRVQR